MQKKKTTTTTYVFRIKALTPSLARIKTPCIRPWALYWFLLTRFLAPPLAARLTVCIHVWRISWISAVSFTGPIWAPIVTIRRTTCPKIEDKKLEKEIVEFKMKITTISKFRFPALSSMHFLNISSMNLVLIRKTSVSDIVPNFITLILANVLIL